MSSVALPREVVSPPARARALATLLADHGQGIILTLPIAALTAALLIFLPQDFGVDSWLGLVTGRVVWQQGVPHHEVLTLFSLGRTWVDQQWLAQLSMYALYLAGGLALVGFVNVALFVSGIAMATVAARRHGAPSPAMLATLAISMAMIVSSREIRTQALAIPLFVGLAWLLSNDSRTPSRRVFWCLPILALWANLHGSVTLGATLVGLHVVLSAWQNRAELRHSARAWLRPASLLAGSAVALLVTPYGLSIVGYYQSTMVSSTLRHVVTEWQPLMNASAGTIVSVLLACGVALWSFGRNPEGTTRWEKVAFLFVALSTFEMMRNALWLALLTILILPLSLPQRHGSTRAAASARFRLMLNATIALLCAGFLLGAVALTFARPGSRIEYYAQRPGVLAAVEHAQRADPSLHLIALEDFSDWLLWRDPGLSGHVAFDARFELMQASQINAEQTLFDRASPDWKRAAQGYRLVVLSRSEDPAALTGFRREPGIRVLYNDGQRVVMLRSAAQAEKS